ncbi:N-acetyltransferase GCN5 [Pseudovibrio japonicus]|uniref:N-acetyltransferase GCN5 n=1 Tax=Pseudovibrio japonicus TaxID=366534 RepID=A0ABQ3E769_9HYPH|nr:GNAT family N-acetyltransferase [Pseudovibrio japonicus]GHB24677.1 N-acetyltransferase GCN5 [Pseudovibrio japonicus]
MTTFPRLRTASLTLREWKETDALRVQKILNNQNVTRMLSGSPYPYTLAHAEVFLQNRVPDDLGRAIHWAIELQGEVVGGIGARPLHETPIMGWWLSEDHWRKGIMYEAAREALSYLLLERELPKVFADAFSDNTGSLRLVRKLGFVHTGKNEGSSRARPDGNYPTEEFLISPLDFIEAQQAREQELAQ